MKDFNVQRQVWIERVLRWGGGIFSIIFGVAFAAMPACFIWDVLQSWNTTEGKIIGLVAVLFLSVFVIAGLSIVFRGVRLIAGKGPMFNRTFSGGSTRTDGPPTSISGSSASDGRRVGIVFGLIFLLAGCGMFYGFAIRPISAIAQARSWTPVSAEVTHSAVKEHSDSDGSTYSIDIGYCYQIDGESVAGNRYSFFGGSSSGYDGKKAVVNQYPAGHSFTVFVNPDCPTESVICRGLTGQAWIMIFPLPFMVAGLFVMGVSWRIGKPLRSSYGASSRRQNRMPMELKPAKGRFALVGFLLFFGLFWNGILSVFVVQLVHGWRAGHARLGETLFMIPFVLIGLGVIGAFIWSLMKLANPRVIVTLNQTEIVLGVPVSGRVRIEGASHRLENLKISLAGREEASYQRGTTTHTEKRGFYEEILLEKNLTDGVLNSEVRFTVPGNSMHSFSGLHNKIIWLLRVEGAIQRWPDVKDEYPIEVLPPEGMVS